MLTYEQALDDLADYSTKIFRLEAVLRGLINWYGDDGEMGTDADLNYWVERAREAIGGE